MLSDLRQTPLPVTCGWPLAPAARRRAGYRSPAGARGISPTTAALTPQRGGVKEHAAPRGRGDYTGAGRFSPISKAVRTIYDQAQLMTE